MQFTSNDAETLARILKWRRDVRHFKTEAIDEAILDRLRCAMECAPSVGNARPWRVIRVNDVVLRKHVRDDFAECNLAAAAQYSGDRQRDYVQLKLEGLEAAPVQLAVFTAVDPAEGHGLGRQTLPETLRQSTAMAVHSLWLAARAENIALGIVSIFDPRALERVFDVPAGWEFSAYLCLGYPEFTDDLPLLHRVDWQQNNPTTWHER